MNMRTLVLRKVIYVIITLFAIITFNFFLFRIMPGDPTRVLVPRGGSEELRQAILERFYLDRPLWDQFVHYIYQVFTLDFGISTGIWKLDEIAPALVEPLINTILLVGIGTALAIFFGVMLGRYAAWRRGTPADTVGMAFALTFYSMPTFLFALVILMIFAGELEWFPLKGPYGQLPFVTRPPDYLEMSITEKLISRGYHLVLPVFAFTIEVMAEFALIMRNSLTDVLTEDYIVTARAKGLSNRAILKDHAMRNAMLPVVTVAAISVGWVLGGDIMVEIVFSYKGLGWIAWDAVNQRDFCVLQALFLIMAVAVLIANFLADLIYMYLDPRVNI
ncbi:MAG: ABC transporter permease [Candidatus Thermoplasmatota archaeon]|nr:ABC transporter permease [Candidatus Thermoplasmatota archaeon]